MAVALGVLVALAWGSADFLGGFTSQRVHTVTVLLVSQTFGLAAAILLVVALRDAAPDPHVFVESAIAGVVGVAALWLLFRGLALGRMSVVAPLSAVGGGVLPVAWGLLHGEHPTAPTLVGVALALIAVVVVGRGAEHDPVPSVPPSQEVALGIGAGIGFGGGIISFLSPCVLPIVPGYLSLVTGLTMGELEEPDARRLTRIAINTGLFVLGFTIVFVALFLTTWSVSDVVFRNQETLTRV